MGKTKGGEETQTEKGNLERDTVTRKDEGQRFEEGKEGDSEGGSEEEVIELDIVSL